MGFWGFGVLRVSSYSVQIALLIETVLTSFRHINYITLKYIIISLLLLMLLFEFSDGWKTPKTRKSTLIQLFSKTAEVLPPLWHRLLRLFGLGAG